MTVHLDKISVIEPVAQTDGQLLGQGSTERGLASTCDPNEIKNVLLFKQQQKQIFVSGRLVNENLVGCVIHLGVHEVEQVYSKR